MITIVPSINIVVGETYGKQKLVGVGVYEGDGFCFINFENKDNLLRHLANANVASLNIDQEAVKNLKLKIPKFEKPESKGVKKVINYRNCKFCKTGLMLKLDENNYLLVVMNKDEMRFYGQKIQRSKVLSLENQSK